MKAVYLEIVKRPGRRSVRRWRGQERALVRVQEAVGSLLGLFGFLLLMGAGGAEEIPAILGLGVTGLGLMCLGAWMAHAFYGQEAKAEWLRRMRERDGDE